MNRPSKLLALLVKLISLLTLASADTYSVKISTDRFVNVVDSRFLSFTVDPSYLFASSEKYNSKECICMASALTPAYIRIAGPSTSHMTFQNATITFTDLDLYKGQTDLKDFNYSDLEGHRDVKGSKGHSDHHDTKGHTDLIVTHGQWKKFVNWAQATGFDLVFALNNEEKMDSGLWDPNSTLNILTMAEKADIEDMYWQLGFQCSNQTIEDYLNDLETLRLIIESFDSHAWRTLGGDVTPCLSAESKSDFKDYVMLADDVMDALMLNGNASAQELERMSEAERLKFLHHLSISTTPLWLTESPNPLMTSELHRAADWMTSLGYSARNGFAVHFRELVEEELYEPSLSFYMALLFKNLVGERVLDLSIEASQAVLFAHCTSLRHKPVPGAVTLFGANMDDDPARFSVKMSRREEGGDVMQFILGIDRTGNIVVNGRAMYYKGDIRPVVKQVRPYKSLLLNLPPKSFGFWVITNTKVEACHEISNKTELVEALPVTDEDIVASNSIKTKRSMSNRAGDDIDLTDYNEAIGIEMNGLKNRIDNLNEKLEGMHSLFQKKAKSNRKTKRDIFNSENETAIGKLKKLSLSHKQVRNRLSDGPKNRIAKSNRRTKRDIFDSENKTAIGKLKKLSLRHKQDRNRLSDGPKNRFEPLRKLLETVHSRFDKTRVSRQAKGRKMSKLGKHNMNKRYHQTKKAKTANKTMSIEENDINVDHKLSRRRRAILSENHNATSKRKEQKSDEEKYENYGKKKNHKAKKFQRHTEQKKKYNREEISNENEVDLDDDNDKANLWKILRQIHKQLEDLPIVENQNVEYVETDDSKNFDQIVVKKKLSDDRASVNFSEKSEHGLLKSTLQNVLTVLTDLNQNLHRFWDALSLLE